MQKSELILYILDSDIFKEWHWFNYHFSFYLHGREHSFAKAMVESLCNIDEVISDYARVTINKIASLSGKEKYLPHYEQLLQICSEIYVINQAVNYFKNENVTFIYEPTHGKSKKNPEISIKFSEYEVGIEVKQPSLIDHIKERGRNSTQISTRIPGFLDVVKEYVNPQNITLPRDNPVKDFLISSNEKFSSFKNKTYFYSILFIVWDDFIYEPISALVGKPSGLFLEESFAKDENGDRLEFENIDAVILDRQLNQILSATRDEPLDYGKKHAFDYGSIEKFPFKVILDCPDSDSEIPDNIKECFQVKKLSAILGAEYMSSDHILWL